VGNKGIYESRQVLEEREYVSLWDIWVCNGKEDIGRIKVKFEKKYELRAINEVVFACWFLRFKLNCFLNCSLFLILKILNGIF